MTHEQHLKPRDIAKILQIGVKAAKAKFAQVNGVVFVPRGGMKRRYQEVRVPPAVFRAWMEVHGPKSSRSTAASRSL